MDIGSGWIPHPDPLLVKERKYSPPPSAGYSSGGEFLKYLFLSVFLSVPRVFFENKIIHFIHQFIRGRSADSHSVSNSLG